jgi:hypothetical protein
MVALQVLHAYAVQMIKQNEKSCHFVVANAVLAHSLTNTKKNLVAWDVADCFVAAIVSQIVVELMYSA